MKIIATTSLSDYIDDNFYAFLAESGLQYIPRQNRSLPLLQSEYQSEGIVVWYKGGPVLFIGEQKFFFHPNMAKNRISLYRKSGITDPLVTACEIKPGDRFLDCTLGLGADSIVAAYFTQGSRVTGLESSPIMAAIVEWGMKLYQHESPWLINAIQQIEVVKCDHYSYLSNLGDKFYDIVYFDPMFRKPLLKSQALSPLRILANHEPVTQESLQQACRVARKRVVIKEQTSSGEFERLGIKKIVGSSNNKINFGIIDCTE
ncbi:MAG: class I SAM-dependent methyltransferase [Syntrophomonadaceae bacterium]|nr:class I SAM-dependent methyltransferase [Syntrophomonadaceae bacterium]